MLAKLALGNVRKSLRDYTIYFITIAFGVCIFYTFNSIESQQVMINATESQQMALKLLGGFMDAFSVFISLVLCFLIVYANNFLIKRRKKEFGIYLILGMEKRSISWILVLETVLVGLAGLIFGIILGIVVSQGMTLVTAWMLNSEVTAYQFVFSQIATIKTVIYFGLTFLLTLIFNIITINKQQLIDLINSVRKNERFTPPHLIRSVLLFIGALGCIAVAYYLMSQGTLFNDQVISLAIIALIVLGTFVFFLSLSGFFLKLLQQCKGLYLRNLNMFILRQINSRIHTNYVSMAFVCLMISIAIAALSSGTAIAGAITAEQRDDSPFDATLSIQRTIAKGTDELAVYAPLDIPRALQSQGIDLDSLGVSWVALPLYKGPAELNIQLPDGYVSDLVPNIIRLSDYNAAAALRGEKPLTLSDGRFVLRANQPEGVWKDALVKYLEGNPTIDIGGSRLSTSLELFNTTIIETLATRTTALDVIVSDAVVDAAVQNGSILPVHRTIVDIDYGTQTKESTVVDDALAQLVNGRSIVSADGVELGFILETKNNVMQTGSSATTIISYIALYLGMVFLIAAAALLAIAQLSETSDNVSRYRLLCKIGTEERMLRHALFCQIAIYFGAPLLLACAHAFVGILALNSTLSTMKGMDLLGSSLFAALVMVIIYGGYFLATYLGSRSILDREAIRQIAVD
ncbi:MAG: FtsX-like permease family protein [Coriobacteriales bacterium]|jgi:putative ABC transport system permease protein|nr:FtsX-like permease family protein [Coriobacteriales bacterium]